MKRTELLELPVLEATEFSRWSRMAMSEVEIDMRRELICGLIVVVVAPVFQRSVPPPKLFEAVAVKVKGRPAQILVLGIAARVAVATFTSTELVFGQPFAPVTVTA